MQRDVNRDDRRRQHADDAPRDDSRELNDHEESPYDEGEIGAWYGGDTGMGDTGTSQEDPAAR